MKNELIGKVASRPLEQRIGVIRQDRLLSYRHALVVANLVEHLVQCLKKEEVCFSYIRQDNSVCHARGTLLGYTEAFGKPYQDLPGNQFLLYYDIECNRWITFHLSFLLQVNKIY